MSVKTFFLACIGVLAAFSATSSAALQTAGEFTCPYGQTENAQCAASCCSQYGGTYSYTDMTCEVASAGDWNSISQCEQASSCCESSASTSPGSGSGCCGPAFLLGMVVAGAFVTSGKCN